MNSTKRSTRQSHKKPISHEVKDVESGIPLRTLESIYDSKHMFFSQEDFQGWWVFEFSMRERVVSGTVNGLFTYNFPDFS